MASTLGEILVHEKLITLEELKSSQEFQKKHDIPLGSAILALGFVTGEEMAQGLSRSLGYPYVDIE